jgi:hypothetical protein
MKTLVACISSHSFDWTLGRGVELDGRRFVHKKIFFNDDDPPSGPNRRVQTVRETWAKTLKERPHVDLRFFYGLGAQRMMEPDEVLLNAPDGYRGLVSKVKGVFQWSLKHDYDFVLKIDDDTFLSQDVIQRIDANPEQDYVGTTLGRIPSHTNSYACGGCYRLSKKALQILDAERIHRFSFQFAGMDLASPKSYPCEDAWVGWNLATRGIEFAPDPTYLGWTDDPEFVNARMKKLCAVINSDSGGVVNSDAIRSAAVMSHLRHNGCSREQMLELYSEEVKRNEKQDEQRGNQPMEEYAK